MSKFKIEKNNISVPGHSGFGRITLIGKNEIPHKTEKQAAQIIGDQIIRCANELLRRENLDFRDFGVEIELTFKTYKRTCQK